VHQALPHLPLLRLRSSRNDLLRSLLERQPAWGHVGPMAAVVTADRGVSTYRLAAESFALQVHWRWHDEAWEERDVVVVPGATVALRLVLDDIQPAAITRALELTPTRAFGKGESGPRGRSVRDEGLWIHEVWPGGAQFAEEKIAELVALLRGRPGLRQVLGERSVTWAGVTVKLRGCLECMGGLALDAAVLADLAGLALALDLDVAAD
jgi:hypothetical protein